MNEQRISPAGECPTCQGAGWYRYDVPMGHVLWARPQRCPCKASEDAARRWARVREVSHYTTEMDHMTLAAWNRARFPDAYRAVCMFAAEVQGWLVLVGPPGTGKTHLAAACVACMRERGRYPLYTLAPRLLDWLRDGINEHQVDKRLRRLETADVLLLDELGADSETDWAMGRLGRVLDYRFANRLPTLLCSNLHTDEWPYRLASRAHDPAVSMLCVLAGEDYRPQRALRHERNERHERGW